MKYICEDCGLIFDRDEVATWDEYRGEFNGFPSYEKMAGCPRCRSTDIVKYKGDEENNG